MRHHHEVDDNDFDENGLIKDGRGVRVPLTMMDSLDPLQKALAAAAAARPTPGRAGYVFDSADSHTTKMRAYDQAKVALGAAWKGGLDQNDVVTYGGRQMTVDADPDTGRPVLRSMSAADGEARKQSAFNNSVRDMNDAWKKPPPKKREEEEDPDKHEWEMAGPLSDGQSVKDAARAEYEANLVDAWRR